MMEKLGTYELTGHLTSQNSGYSVWGFGRKNGRDYFIKQFLSPKYPENDTVSSPERLKKKINQCRRFEQRKVAVYQKLNENSDGNAVRVEEFFRIESKYYITMRKIEALPWDVEKLASLPEEEKYFLCAIIAHGIAGLHKGRVIHADLKHDNVLFMRTPAGNVTAKIIDFDSSFLETDPPAAGEEIIGDLVYFSPEACRSIWGEELELTCKMDIFSLGVLFHQYFAGELPGFDREKCTYPGEAVAKGESITVSPDLPEDLRDLLERMMLPDPALRPTAMEVYHALSKKLNGTPAEPAEAYTVEPPAPEVVAAPVSAPKPAGTFFRPGDL